MIVNLLKNRKLNIMKKNILLSTLLFLFICTRIHAQFGIGSPKVLEEIKENTLIVVLKNDAENYNKNLRAYVEKNWKYGDYKFITLEEVGAYRKKKDVFFLATKKINAGTTENPRLSNSLTISKDSRLTVPYGSKSNIAIVNTFLPNMNEISEVHLASLLKVLFDTIDEFENATLKQTKPSHVADHYNPQNDASTFKNKTLLIPKTSIPIGYVGREDYSLLEPAEIAKYYSHEFKIVEEEELSEFIKADDGQFLYLNASQHGPLVPYFLFDIEQNKMVYFNAKKQGFGAVNNLSVFKKALEDLDELMK